MEIIEEFGSIGIFSNEGFEHVHSEQKVTYYTSTNHDGGKNRISSIFQIIQKSYRIKWCRLQIESKSYIYLK